jgi:hypothetical protein
VTAEKIEMSLWIADCGGNGLQEVTQISTKQACNPPEKRLESYLELESLDLA